MNKHTTIKLGSALLTALLLSACGTTVPLDNASGKAQVEDRNAVANGAGSSGSSAQSQGAASDKANSSPYAVDGKSPAGLSLVVYFDFDSFSIKPEYSKLIADHAKFLTADSNRKIMLEGHADERGTREYNLALGQERSEAVRRALGVLSTKESQMEAVSFGEEKPAAAGSSEEAWTKNRRVEIKYQ